MNYLVIHDCGENYLLPIPVDLLPDYLKEFYSISSDTSKILTWKEDKIVEIDHDNIEATTDKRR